MTFNVNYKINPGQPDDGMIVSYQEGGEPSDNDVPDGHGTLSFASVFAPMFDKDGNVTMRVDTQRKELVFLNPVEIPKPL